MAAALEVRVDLRDLDRMWRRYPTLLRVEVERALNEATITLERDVKRNLMQHVITGVTRASVTSDIDVRAGRGGLDFVARVYSQVPWIRPLEYGQRPHGVPHRHLLLWAQRKLLSRWGAKYRRAPRREPPTRADRRRLRPGEFAWVVARSIAQRGTRAVRAFERAFRDRRVWILERFGAARERFVERINRGER